MNDPYFNQLIMMKHSILIMVLALVPVWCFGEKPDLIDLHPHIDYLFFNGCQMDVFKKYIITIIIAVINSANGIANHIPSVPRS